MNKQFQNTSALLFKCSSCHCFIKWETFNLNISKKLLKMGKLTVFLLFPCLLSCSANPIGMFDFNNRNSSQLGSQFGNSTIMDVAAAIFKGDIKETFPEKVTICNTIYADLDDMEISLYTDDSDWYRFRAYPTWAFVNDSGRANLSILVESNSLKTEALRLWIRGVKAGRVELGRLQLSIS